MNRKRLKWRKQALADLQAFHDWLATLESAKPTQIVQRIRFAAESLSRLGDIGRPGAVAGLRELSVQNAPYVIVYRCDNDVIEIVAVYHTAQDR